jgi:MscS family membrane protein
MRILEGIGEAHPETCAQPTPRARMRAFGASSLDFDLLIWIEHPEQRGLIRHELLMEIYKAFDREGIEIPYSKHDVYIKQMSAPEGD